ncbi:uncharacterized protein LOC117170895 [Belonocnema kinseyi]|uniref:uncharacterized protein LOC117170895 n=1 Tax=Belonocnema kinseyi TaxID=2817044 RepID=UPI00143D563F|nr:uncharacterized protein LOC117170895 [Belonocnema kinseyi]
MLADANKSDPEMQKLSREISSSFPLIHFDNSAAADAQYLGQIPSFNNPRSTLFIIITSFGCNVSLSIISRPINFITQLEPAKIRPKVLILTHVKKSSNYNDLLRFMWSRRFLDATVLEIILRKYSKMNCFMNIHLADVTQHYFIPFTESFVQKKYCLESDLFPDKLRNLHGYTMKVGLFHYPPHVFFFRNLTAHIINFDGPDILAMNALSKALNFKVLKLISNKTTWDVSSCLKEKNVGLFHSAMYNNLQFIGVKGIISNICLRKLMEKSTNIRPLSTVAVVPIFADCMPKLSTQWKFYNAIALVIMLLITWLITRLLNFNKQNWRIEYLMQILLGLGIPREPRVLAERIVLGSMLFACVLQSSFIFSAFTSIDLIEKPQQEINNIDDLISSNLQPLLLPNVHRHLKDQSDGRLMILTKQSITKDITDEICVQYLVSYKNVTCFMRKTRANWLIKKYRDVDGQPVMRVLKDALFDLTAGNYMEAASPYAIRFENLMRRFMEAGVMIKWNHHLFSSQEAIIPGENAFLLDVVQFNVQIRKNIFFVLIFGYTFSGLVYIGEVVIYYFQKLIKHNL